MRTEKLTEKQRALGQLIVDFANATTTDEACFRYFENLQQITPEFSADFAERAKKAFPSENALRASLTEDERTRYDELDWPSLEAQGMDSGPNQIKYLHLCMQGVQKEYRDVLQSIVQGKRLHQVSSFLNLLKIYNDLPKKPDLPPEAVPVFKLVFGQCAFPALC